MEKEKQSTMKVFAELSSHDASIDKELISQKVCAVCTFNIEHCFIWTISHKQLVTSKNCGHFMCVFII